VVLFLFLGSLTVHWTFAWFAYLDDQRDLNHAPELNGYLNAVIRDTMENWQSEALQLFIQVGGLALFLSIGSPTSKNESQRLEKKIDYIMDKLDGGTDLKNKLDKDYMRTD
jgi:hypothetical protein